MNLTISLEPQLWSLRDRIWFREYVGKSPEQAFWDMNQQATESVEKGEQSFDIDDKFLAALAFVGTRQVEPLTRIEDIEACPLADILAVFESAANASSEPDPTPATAAEADAESPAPPSSDATPTN